MLKFKTLTLGVDGQPDDHSFKTPLLELRGHSLRGPLHIRMPLSCEMVLVKKLELEATELNLKTTTIKYIPLL